MREAYQDQLEAVTSRLVGMTAKTGDQIRDATQALLGADRELAEQVVAADISINRDKFEIDEQVIELLATQGPVASDLRVVTSALRITADIERMGDLAVHIAKIARMRYPEHAVPEKLRETFTLMGSAAQAMAEQAGVVLETRDLKVADQLASADDEIDRLHRSLFAVLLDDEWDRGVEPAVDIALLGRYYERFADHAVEIAASVRYLVTGEVYPGYW